MGILKNLTEEYFGEIEREEDLIDIVGLDVEIVSFTDNNGKKHRRGYKPKDKDTLEKLLERMIKIRGDEGDFNDIDTSDIESMVSLFNDKKFNGDITGWNVSNVRNMSHMFYYAKSFNQPIGNWKFPKVKDMSSMFSDATSFNQPIGNWEFPNVENMNRMFWGASSFNQPIGNWKFPKVENMKFMFSYAESFNQPIGDWKFPNVTDMSGMFYGASSFNQDLSEWNLKGKNITDMFSNCPIVDKYKPKMK